MKKIIAILLSVIMLVSVLSVAAFAEDYEALGQHVITLAEKSIPTIDGYVDEGEYTHSESVSKETTIYGSDTITATYYHFSYDDEYLYIGGVVEDASTHVNYVNALFAYVGGDITDLDDAWRIYMTKSNGTMVEHWQITDSVCSENYWNPIDSANGEAYKHGMGDKEYEFAQSFDGKVYHYELALNRADWGIDGDSMFIAMEAQSSDHSMDIYGFKSDELISQSSGLSAKAEAKDYGVYMHRIDFTGTGSVVPSKPETDPADSTPKEYSIMDLAEYGQQHWTINGKTENAPIADGVIDDGEYTLEVEGMDPFNEAADGRFFCVDPQALDVQEFNVYFSYDDDYIYIGVKVVETEFLAGENISFFLYPDPIDMDKNVAIGYVFGGAPDSSDAEAFNAVQDGDTVTYEMAIRKTILADYLGLDEDEEINEFAFLVVLGDDRDTVNAPDLWPEMWFGVNVPNNTPGLASSYEEAIANGMLYGRAKTRFPHVLELGEAVETEPQETTPAETEPTETEPQETTPVETAPVETEPVAEGGCGASVAAVAVALVSTLGLCVTFASKKN